MQCYMNSQPILIASHIKILNKKKKTGDTDDCRQHVPDLVNHTF